MPVGIWVMLKHGWDLIREQRRTESQEERRLLLTRFCSRLVSKQETIGTSRLPSSFVANAAVVDLTVQELTAESADTIVKRLCAQVLAFGETLSHEQRPICVKIGNTDARPIGAASEEPSRPQDLQ